MVSIWERLTYENAEYLGSKSHAYALVLDGYRAYVFRKNSQWAFVIRRVGTTEVVASYHQFKTLRDAKSTAEDVIAAVQDRTY